MKKAISPIMAVAVVLAVVLIAGIFIWHGTSQQARDGDKPPGMPPEVAAEFQRRMGNSNTTAPQASTPGATTASDQGAVPPGGYVPPPPTQ